MLQSMIPAAADPRTTPGPAPAPANELARPLLHVGYPKTGSTWLQRTLEGLDGCTLRRVGTWRNVREHVVRPNALWYEPQEFLRLVNPQIEGCVQDHTTPWISSELLIGIPDNGGYNSVDIARRLKGLFPNGRVVIVVREQRSFLLSVYKEYVRNGGSACLRDYLRPRGMDRYPTFDPRYLEYHRIIGCYQELFGRDNVLVLAQEQLQRDAVAFCNRILAFADAGRVGSVPSSQERVGFPPATIVALRWWNRWFRRHDEVARGPKWIRALTGWLPGSLGRALDRRWAGQIDASSRGRYEESNRQTQALTGLDLEGFGYPVAGSSVSGSG